jgi:hypothetical protein
MNPFDLVEDISYGKKMLISDENEKDYNAFMINRALSYYPDTILYAQEMNVNHHVDNKMQHDYLFFSIAKRKRYSKWAKKQITADVKMIQEYYGCNYKRAEEAASILSKDQLKYIKGKLEKGGLINKKNSSAASNEVNNVNDRITFGGENS